MSHLPRGSLNQLEPITTILLAAAETTAHAVARYRYVRRRRRYRMLRPGLDTPLWNELAAAVNVYLRRRGEKAQLARVLGVPRQRIHKILVEQSACPDAERTLLLLCWVAARQRGETFG